MGLRHTGHLSDCSRSVLAHSAQQHTCRQGSTQVSRGFVMQITHSFDSLSDLDKSPRPYISEMKKPRFWIWHFWVMTLIFGLPLTTRAAQ